MPSMLHIKWTTAKKAAAPDDLKRCNFNKDLGSVLEKLDKRIDAASENDKPPAKDVAEMTKLFTSYQSIANDYLQQILKANQKYPGSGKSWLVLHEGLRKTDEMLVLMLKDDSNMKGPWKRISGFVTASDFQSAPVAQPPANPQLTADSLKQYNADGFKRLVDKMSSAGSSTEQAKAFYVGLNTCLPHNKTLVNAVKNSANAIGQLATQFDQFLAKADFKNAQNRAEAFEAEAKKVAAAVPAEGKALVQLLDALAADLKTRLQAKLTQVRAAIIGS